MKITTFLLFLVISSVSASSLAQEKLTVKLKNANILEVLDIIEEKTNLGIIFRVEELNLSKKYDLDKTNVSIFELLDEVLRDEEVTYKVIENTVILHRRQMQYRAYNLQQQGITIRGRVIDHTGEPLPGVNVYQKGNAQNGVITGVDGSYTIDVDNTDAGIVFSFIGFVTQELNVAGRSQINVTLIEEITGLDEVVVVGYGTQKKSNIVSAISSVKAEEMTKIPTTDVGEMLRGKATGVLITLNDASPGGSSNILIRGKSSINGGTNPLIVVDGVPVGSMNDVNPSDIASLDVLKDASSQAIYGARASNGVILITTHRGSKGKTSVSYDGFVGVQNAVNRNFDIYNGDEFAQLRREAWRTDNNGLYKPDDEIFSALQLSVMEKGEYIDWEDEILNKNAIVSQHNINISGGGESTKFALSLGYYDQDGLLPNSSYQRYNFRINLDQKVSDWLSVGANVSYYRGDRARQPYSLNTFTLSPIGEIYNEDGSYRQFIGDQDTHFNPFINIEETNRESITHKGVFNVFADFQLPFDIKYRLNASYRNANGEDGSYQSSLEASGRSQDGIAHYSTSNTYEYLLENIFTWEKSMGKHKVDFTGVHSVNQKKWGRTSVDAFGFASDILGWKGMEGALTQQTQRSETQRRLLSFMGRARYSFDNKYVLTLTARADASSVFGANNKWGYFPSAAVGWNMHHESFLEDVDWLSQLKLRASYGQTGNEAIAPYQSLGTASQYFYIFGDDITAGYSPGYELSNPDLKWETSTSLNTGIDFGFLRGQIQGAFEYYHTKTTDLLVSRNVIATSGYTKMLDNVGSLVNEGIEFSITAHLVKNNNLKVSLTPMFSANRNEITELYGGIDVISSSSTSGWLMVDESIDIYYDYVFDGIWQTGDDILNSHMPDAQPGDIRIKDLDESGDINEDDRMVYNETPDWMGSLALNVDYKGWDLSADVYTVQGGIDQNAYLFSYNQGGDIRGTNNGIIRDYWTPENPSTTAPRPSYGAAPAYIRTTSYVNTSFVRLRSVVLGYSFGPDVLKKLGLEKLRLYTSVTNPYTWMDYPSYSPEKEPGSYPEAFTYNFGVNVNF